MPSPDDMPRPARPLRPSITAYMTDLARAHTTVTRDAETGGSSCEILHPVRLSSWSGRSSRPDGEEGVTSVVGRCAALDCRLVPAA
jgi:hypothetical protein